MQQLILDSGVQTFPNFKYTEHVVDLNFLGLLLAVTSHQQPAYTGLLSIAAGREWHCLGAVHWRWDLAPHSPVFHMLSSPRMQEPPATTDVSSSNSDSSDVVPAGGAQHLQPLPCGATRVRRKFPSRSARG